HRLVAVDDDEGPTTARSMRSAASARLAPDGIVTIDFLIACLACIAHLAARRCRQPDRRAAGRGAPRAEGPNRARRGGGRSTEAGRPGAIGPFDPRDPGGGGR